MTDDYSERMLYINTPDGPVKVYTIGSGSRRVKMYECLDCGFRTEDPEWDDDGEDDFPVCPKCGYLMEGCGYKEVEQDNSAER